MKPKFVIPLLLSFFFVNICFSQTYIGSEANQRVKNTELVKFKDYTEVPNYFRFSENSTHTEQETIDIVKGFIKNNNSDLQLKIAQKQGDGNFTLRYFQTVNGYPIEFTALNLQLINNKITEVNGEILDNPQITPNFLISEETALQFALNYVNAKEYMWEDEKEYLPEGEKVIVTDKIEFANSILKSAYKFNIYSKNPHNRQMVYVDAENGEIVMDLPLLHFDNVVGTAQTAYYGVREINTDYTGTQYTLYDATRGNGIHTYNCNNTANWLNNYYTNSTTIWNNTPYGTDAHFSTISTYDYFFQKHGYNSINNAGFALKSYVNFNLVQYGYPNNINAFWNGSCMTYGNGNPPTVTALTTIDICGHEITHGLNTFTANLVYSYESGALSEGFSDIFGTAIEFFAVPEDANWTMGEKMGLIIRSLSNPKAYGLPDTYKGQHWYNGSGDNGGVHYNCGPLSYWFYLLCVGKAGINDYGNSYNVAAIGMSKAEKIAFKLLTHYLTPNSNYADACFYGLQAAADLYGACSDEVKSVGDAFYAIGVLQQPYVNQAVADFKANMLESCSFPLTVQFTNTSFNCVDFVWDFGDGSPTSTQKNPTHIYTQNGSFTVTLTGSANSCGTDTKIKQNYINISPSLPCTYIMTQGTQTVESCFAMIYDDGGPDGNYSNNLNSTLTVHSVGATSIFLNFLEFDVEAGTGSQCNYDYLEVRSGNSVSSPLVGKYCNNVPPPATLTITGEYVTFRFVSDMYVNGEGYKIELLCVGPNNPPFPAFDSDITNSCNGVIKFTDKSLGSNINSWLWDFGDGKTSTLKNPEHQYRNNGSYNVTLTAGNDAGENSITKYNYIVIDKIIVLGNHEFKVYDTLAFELYVPGASENLKWFAYNEENPYETTPLFVGNPIQHPPVLETIKYKILDEYEDHLEKVGELDCNSNGSYFTLADVHYLVFDVFQNFELKSVLVNANSAENRTISLRNASGETIWTKTVYIPAGVSRITIDKVIPIGTNLQLAGPPFPNLYRSNSANLQYPYNINNVVSIKSSSVSSNPTSFYYYFYDWEISVMGCISELGTISVILSTKEQQPEPESPKLDNVTTTSIALVAVENCEYRMVGGKWQTSPVFSELIPDSHYTFTQRLAETATHYASPESMSSTFKTDKEVDIEEITNSNLRIYPNPTTGEFRVTGNKLRVTSIEIYDVYGRMQKGEWRMENGEWSFDLSNLSSGIYFIKVMTENEIIMKKIIKH
ncbi:MAG: M4 family metallopeptidase [Bacteroidales bacterium]|jgi:Zn-dependent metalloprotease/PKD repeat protein|nr:M4 family metallopeptidase [Bacteroidales bacterium]